MTQNITVEFECVNLPRIGPTATDYQRLGIQNRQEVTQDIDFAESQAVRFQFSLEVDFDPAGNLPRFRGNVVQGTRQQPFIYLCWGDRVDGTWKTSRCAKFLLNALSRQTIEQALKGDKPIQVKIRMTTPAGSPAAATLKPDQYQVI